MYRLIKSEREHLEDLVELIKKYPNNYVLGEKVRSYFLNLTYDKKKSLKTIKDRIKYIKKELIHENYWDGFTVKGFKDELKELEKKLNDMGKQR